jgi:hypothetical protein
MKFSSYSHVLSTQKIEWNILCMLMPLLGHAHRMRSGLITVDNEHRVLSMPNSFRSIKDIRKSVSNVSGSIQLGQLKVVGMGPDDILLAYLMLLSDCKKNCKSFCTFICTTSLFRSIHFGQLKAMAIGANDIC